MAKPIKPIIKVTSGANTVVPSIKVPIIKVSSSSTAGAKGPIIPASQGNIKVTPIIAVSNAGGKLAPPAIGNGFSAPQIKVAAPPKVSVTNPASTIPAPQIKVIAPQIKVVAPQIKVAAPQIKVAAPQIKVGAPQIKVAAPQIKLPTSALKIPPKVNVGAPQIKLPSKPMAIPNPLKTTSIAAPPK